MSVDMLTTFSCMWFSVLMFLVTVGRIRLMK